MTVAKPSVSESPAVMAAAIVFVVKYKTLCNTTMANATIAKTDAGVRVAEVWRGSEGAGVVAVIAVTLSATESGNETRRIEHRFGRSVG